MAETLTIERTDSLLLEALEAGSRLRVLAGEEPEQYQYDFVVIKPGEEPRCLFMQTSPDGEMVGPTEAILEGTSRQTTVAENPVQAGDPLWGRPRQEIATSIYYGIMRLGQFAMVIDPETRTRYQLQPACTEITVLGENT